MYLWLSHLGVLVVIPRLCSAVCRCRSKRWPKVLTRSGTALVLIFWSLLLIYWPADVSKGSAVLLLACLGHVAAAATVLGNTVCREETQRFRQGYRAKMWHVASRAAVTWCDAVHAAYGSWESWWWRHQWHKILTEFKKKNCFFFHFKMKLGFVLRILFWNEGEQLGKRCHQIPFHPKKPLSKQHFLDGKKPPTSFNKGFSQL